MIFTKEKKDKINIYTIKGKIDSSSASDFEKDFFDLIDSGEQFFIFDFKDVKYISSAGLRIFLVGSKLLKPTDGKIVYCNMNNITKDIFHISGFTLIFDIKETLEEAIEELIKS